MNSTIRSIRAGDVVRGQARRATESMTINLKGGDIRFRLVAMWCFITAMLLVVLLRVTLLQTVWASGYQQASVNQRTRVNIVRAERGSILDRQGFDLALPVPTRTIFADPRVVSDPVVPHMHWLVYYNSHLRRKWLLQHRCRTTDLVLHT